MLTIINTNITGVKHWCSIKYIFQKNQLICRNKNIICSYKVIQKERDMGNDKS